MKYEDAVWRNFTENLMTYALGRQIEAFDQPAIRAIVRGAARQDYKMSAFVLGVIDSPPFRMSRPQTETTTAAR